MTPHEPGERLLLVDDDPDVVWALGRYLTRAGYSVSTCGDGVEALELLGQESFDVIVTDIQMPNLNGISLLEWVRANRPHARVVVITAYVSDSVKRVAARKGAYMFLVKPVDPQLLVEVLRSPEMENKFSGNVEGVDFLDFLQIVLSSHSRHLFEIHDGKGRCCRIWTRGNEVVHAKSEAAEGLDAFAECSEYESGQFVMLPWEEPPQRSIVMSMSHLLLEVARRSDESRNLNQQRGAG